MRRIETKLAKPKDLAAINELLRLSKSYWGYDAAFLDQFMQTLGITEEHLSASKIYLVYIDRNIAGFFNFIIQQKGELELENFFLHPDYIGQGWGRKLWEICCKVAKQMGMDEFILWSDPNAEAFYLKMGCEKIGVRRSPMAANRYPSVLKYRIPG